MAKRNPQIIPKRGEIYFVNFNPTVGTEINKTRPALILQNNISNTHSSITIVAAITSKYDESLYPTEVLIKSPEGGLKQDSVVLLNQIRSIDKKRLMQRLGSIKEDTHQRVNKAIEISLGLIEL